MSRAPTLPKSNMAKAASRIDYDDREQVVRLALASLFTSIAIARGFEATTELAAKCARCADALIESVAEKVKK